MHATRWACGSGKGMVSQTAMIVTHIQFELASWYTHEHCAYIHELDHATLCSVLR